MQFSWAVYYAEIIVISIKYIICSFSYLKRIVKPGKVPV